MTQYTITGFTHDSGFRVFAFECVGEDRLRTEYTVRADLALIRRYGIRVQDLPLLCRAVLEKRIEGGEQRTFTYTEGDMSLHAGDCAIREAAAKIRKTPRRAPTENLGAAWRGPQQ
jgi:hypothetical protein